MANNSRNFIERFTVKETSVIENSSKFEIIEKEKNDLFDSQITPSHTSKLYICEICGLKFTNYRKLGGHVSNRHPG